VARERRIWVHCRTKETGYRAGLADPCDPGALCAKLDLEVRRRDLWEACRLSSAKLASIADFAKELSVTTDSVGLQDNDFFELAKLRQDYENAKQSVLAAHPAWDKWTDARPLALGRCANAIQSIFLCGCHERQNLTSEGWWRKHVSVAITREGCRIGLTMFDSFLIGTAYVMLFSAIEHSVRVFLRALCPGACQDGRAPFQSVYQKLLTELDLKEWEPFLEVWGALRNAVHNNFQFLPTNRKDLKVTFDGVKFSHRDGEHFEADWKLFIWLVAHAKEMLLEIVGSQEMANLATISDPYPQSPADYRKVTSRVVLKCADGRDG